MVLGSFLLQHHHQQLQQQHLFLLDHPYHAAKVKASIQQPRRKANLWLSDDWKKAAAAFSPASSSSSSSCRRSMSSRSAEDWEEYATWERVQLVQRLLQLSVVDENYEEAARLRDALADLQAKLTSAEQIVLMNTQIFKDKDPKKRIQAVEALGDIGDEKVVPTLSAGLRDDNQMVVLETEKAMWRIFMRSGREDVDKRIQEGVAKMVTKDGLAAAREIFTEVIRMAPLFAEGYNKRATVNYLLQDYHKSIQDCFEALKLNPYHFAALSGLGLCYVAIQEPESALCWLEKAYAMHPGLVQISKYIKVLKKKIKDKRSATEE